MKKYLLLNGLLFMTATASLAQVGIGTTNPKAFFNVSAGRTVLFGSDTNQVVSTNKLIWYASQGAFRVGYVDSDAWSRSSASDNTRVGRYSFASGYNSTASGTLSTAMGYNSTASDTLSTAMGQSTARGAYSTAMGQSTASGDNSTAMGQGTTASGDNSTAMGYITTAMGGYSTAMGFVTTASGDFSTAMGNLVSTNQQAGSFILGDHSSANTTTNNDARDQMMMRFAGGYKLFSNAAASFGVYLSPGGNAWQTLSDSTRKENFRSVDGAGFLQKIAQLKLGSWNYKGQDAKHYRHYGPMAQEFFAAFGHDELGVIGEDKSINQADFDGVNLIAIQALIQEVEQLKAQNKSLREENAALKTQTQARLDKIEAALQGQMTSHTLTRQP
ncbi:tail fiber domain-containing protein [Spirosoma validum]|uniref:Tail fiber domain-containing protein n=1 Tax=Spirosoma validum TaxID=2771355 RepID=A0A927GH25_9BACT|nr:tail fiber domain-containing protein [Spirosoma validum]MBD2757494.1 tail fiber domain-containing protein [Spirosoma validum]